MLKVIAVNQLLLFIIIPELLVSLVVVQVTTIQQLYPKKIVTIL